MKQAVMLGIKDGLILEEIGDSFEAEKLFHDAIEAYKICKNVDALNGSVMQKLSSIYCNEENKNQNKDAAIDCLKIAIELVKGDTNKEQLAITLQQLL